MYKYVLSFVFLCCVLSCNYDTPLSVKEFSYNGQQWNSIERTKHIDAIAYRAAEVPLQYYIQKQTGMFQGNKVDSIYQDLSRERVLVVEFQEDNGEDLLTSNFTSRDYDASVRYMAFGIQNDFQIITSSKDTIPCSGVLFERNFNVAPFKRLILHFGDINPEDKIELVYKDQLFGKGTLRFDFDDNPIKL